MKSGKQSAVVLIVLAVAALALLLTFMGDSPLNARHTIINVPAPETDNGALEASVTTGRSRGGLGADNAEVEVTGRWRGAKFNELVMRSQEAKPDMIRIGWIGSDSLVITVPQNLEDVGKPLGTGDPSYRCGNTGSILHVVCEPYSIGPRQERHYDPQPVSPPMQRR